MDRWQPSLAVGTVVFDLGHVVLTAFGCATNGNDDDATFALDSAFHTVSFDTEEDLVASRFHLIGTALLIQRFGLPVENRVREWQGLTRGGTRGEEQQRTGQEQAVHPSTMIASDSLAVPY